MKWRYYSIICSHRIKGWASILHFPTVYSIHSGQSSTPYWFSPWTSKGKCSKSSHFEGPLKYQSFWNLHARANCNQNALFCTEEFQLILTIHYAINNFEAFLGCIIFRSSISLAVSCLPLLSRMKFMWMIWNHTCKRK